MVKKHKNHTQRMALIYLYMMAVSAPMMVIVIGYLRRTGALYPLRTLTAVGLPAWR